MNILPRRWLAPIYLSVFAGVLWLATSIAADLARESRGVALGPDLPVLAGPAVTPYGINASLAHAEGEARERSLALLHDGGFTWVRQEFPWREIEVAKGEFAWQRWDSLVHDYLAHGVRVLAILDRPPSWSRQDNNWPNRPPDRLEDFADFVAAFAGRYRGQIDYLQIWDEPNVFPNWGNRSVDPAGYAEMLAAAYRRAKEANPSARVVLAGLAPNDETGGRNMSDLRFFGALYAAGGGRYYDIAAAKPYGLWYHPMDRHVSPERVNFARVVLWRELMVARGDEGKPIWAVEFGWNSLPGNWAVRPSPWGNVAAEDQAAYTRDALNRARAEWPWLPVLFLEGLSPPGGDDPRAGFSIVDSNGQPGPLYRAVQKLAAQAKTAPVGYHAASSPAFEREGPWQVSGGSIRGFPSAVLAFSFIGTRLDIVAELGPHGAPATVIVDGRPPATLLRIDGSAWLDTYRAPAIPRPERVTVAAGLTEGEHRVEIIVQPSEALMPRRADPAAALDIAGAFVVREALWEPRHALLGSLALLAAAIFGLAVLAAAGWPWIAWGTRLAYGFRMAFRSFAGRVSSLWLRQGDGGRDAFVLALLAVLLAALYLAPPACAPALLLLLIAAFSLRPTVLAFAMLATAPLARLPLPLGQFQLIPSELVVLAGVTGIAARWLPCLSSAGRFVVGGATRLASNKRRPSSDWPALLAALFPRLFRILVSGFYGPVILFVVAACLSTLFAEYPREALRELRTVILEPLLVLVVVLHADLLQPGARQPGFKLRYVRKAIDVLVLVAAAIAILALYQYLFTGDVIAADGVRRVRALYGSPNNLGLFLGRVIPLAACVPLGDRERRWYFAALAPMLGALALTYSAGAWIALGMAALLVAAVMGSRFVLAVSGGMAALSVGVIEVLRLERIVSHFSLDQGTSGLRLLIWQAATKMALDHPLLGVGPDNFLRHYRDRYLLPDAWREPDLSHPHNLLLDFWLRTGLLGLIAALWLVGRFFSQGLHLFRSLPDPPGRALALGLLGGMVDFVVHGLVDNSLFVVDLAVVFWLSLAALEVLRREGYNTGSFR